MNIDGAVGRKCVMGLGQATLLHEDLGSKRSRVASYRANSRPAR